MTHHGEKVQYSWVSDCAMRLVWPHSERDEFLPVIRACAARLHAGSIPALRDVTPAAATVLLTFDPADLCAEQAESAVRSIVESASAGREPFPERHLSIPVCYEPPCGADLDDVSRRCGTLPIDVMTMHVAAAHVVHFIGFAPGFPYMGGLPPQLRVPRLDRPRLRVPAGSVGIAGRYTGIYPHETAGGWRLIGRTPLRLFEAGRTPPSLLALGDRVTLQPISLEQFRSLNEHRV
jgi:inhibitor of KinA